MEASTGSDRENDHGIPAYGGWVYHMGTHSVGYQYFHARYLVIRGTYVTMFKHNPVEHPRAVSSPCAPWHLGSGIPAHTLSLFVLLGFFFLSQFGSEAFFMISDSLRMLCCFRFLSRGGLLVITWWWKTLDAKCTMEGWVKLTTLEKPTVCQILGVSLVNLVYNSQEITFRRLITFWISCLLSVSWHHWWGNTAFWLIGYRKCWVDCNVHSYTHCQDLRKSMAGSEEVNGS